MGNPTIDPTKNVLDLSDASAARQDDLRELNDRRIDAEILHLKAIAEKNAQIAELRADHLAEIIELQRDASARDASASLTAIQTLAATTARDAETLRALVASTATTTANQSAATIGGIVDRLMKLEQSSWSSLGRQQYADPQALENAQKIDALMRAVSLNSGKEAGLSMTGALVIGAVAVISMLTGAVGLIYALLKP